MSFTDEEIAYLRSQPLARLSTVDDRGQPDVVPLAFEFDGSLFWVGSASTSGETRKFRNVRGGNHRVALVIDDLPSLDPMAFRGIRVYGVATEPIERTGLVGPGLYLGITPTVSWSWNLAGEPAGAEWYPVRRAEH